jgi:hypothetical protein
VDQEHQPGKEGGVDAEVDGVARRREPDAAAEEIGIRVGIEVAGDVEHCPTARRVDASRAFARCIRIPAVTASGDETPRMLITRAKPFSGGTNRYAAVSSAIAARYQAQTLWRLKRGRLARIQRRARSCAAGRRAVGSVRAELTAFVIGRRAVRELYDAFAEPARSSRSSGIDRAGDGLGARKLPLRGGVLSPFGGSVRGLACADSRVVFGYLPTWSGVAAC